jgi:hypothetical protein
MQHRPSHARLFAAVSLSYLGVAALFVFAVWLSTQQDTIQLPPPRPEPTMPAVLAAQIPPSWVAVDGLPVVILATPTDTPVPPTPSPEPFVWPTATAVLDFSGAMDTGGR